MKCEYNGGYNVEINEKNMHSFLIDNTTICLQANENTMGVHLLSIAFTDAITTTAYLKTK